MQNDYKKNEKKECDETKNREEVLLKNAAEDGKEYFRQGFNCAECVYLSYRKNYNNSLPVESVAFATAFGGGFASSRNHACGAITGALMALSASFGRKEPFAKETPEERISEVRMIYERFSPLVNEIEEQLGTFVCKELSKPYGDFSSIERKRNCMSLIEYCSELAVKHALRIEEEVKSGK